MNRRARCSRWSLLDAAVAGFVIGGFWISVAPDEELRQEGGVLPGSPGVLATRGRCPGGDRPRDVRRRLRHSAQLRREPRSAFSSSNDSATRRNRRSNDRLWKGLRAGCARVPGIAVPAIVLVVVVFGPAVEELVFRGVVFNGLYRLGAWISTRSRAKTRPHNAW